MLVLFAALFARIAEREAPLLESRRLGFPAGVVVSSAMRIVLGIGSCLRCVWEIADAASSLRAFAVIICRDDAAHCGECIAAQLGDG